MKALKTLVAVALLAVGTTATAQAVYQEDEYTSYEFKKHLFLDIEGGAQYTLGEAKFDKLLSPNVQLGLGYQFSPVFAARLQANAWQSKGGWNGYGNPPMTKDYKWKYVAPGVDLMFNLSNLVCGYNPFRVFNVTAFVGGGANIGFSNDEANDIAAAVQNKSGYLLDYLWDGSKVRPFGRGGIELGFRLSDAVQLNVEGNANILSDKYNSKKADNPDWYFNALVGLRINLGKTYEKHVAEPPKPVDPPKPPVKPDTTQIKKPTPPPYVKPEPLTRNVFFDLNQSVIRDNVEQQKIKDIADYLKQHPASRVTITGYADVETGNDRINDQLGIDRSARVKQVLMEQYGIPESRIDTYSKGARVQPFPINEENRAAVCVAAE